MRALVIAASAACRLCRPRSAAGRYSSSTHPLPRPSGDWNDDHYEVLADGVVVGRLFVLWSAT
jgi:hypothetical protein